MTDEERGACMERGGAEETNGGAAGEAPDEPGGGEETTESDPGGAGDQEWTFPCGLPCPDRQSVHASGKNKSTVDVQ